LDNKVFEAVLMFSNFLKMSRMDRNVSEL